jgi:hypothetical protein
MCEPPTAPWRSPESSGCIGPRTRLGQTSSTATSVSRVIRRAVRRAVTRAVRFRGPSFVGSSNRVKTTWVLLNRVGELLEQAFHVVNGEGRGPQAR